MFNRTQARNARLVELLSHVVSKPDAIQLYAITGGPNSGKTAVIDRLREKGEHVVDEMATILIQNHGNAIKDNIIGFQRLVLESQLREELRLRKTGTVAICDRGIFDAVGYFRAREMPLPVEDRRQLDALAAAASRHMYGVVFVFDTIEQWDDNGVRDENITFSKRLADEMVAGYKEFGFKVVRVPVFGTEREASIEKRAELVMSEIAAHKALIR